MSEDIHIKAFHVYLEDQDALTNYIKRRELVSTLADIVRNCIDSQAGCNNLVLNILGYHRSQIKQNKGRCKLRTFHNCLYVATKLCVIFNLNNTQTVCMVLRDISNCEKTFSRLMNAVLLQRIDNNIITKQWRNDIDPEETDLHALEYFLHHSTIGQQLYPTMKEFLNGPENKWVRFADVMIFGDGQPVYAAVDNRQAESLLLLLRYGVNLSSPLFAKDIYPAIVHVIKNITIWSKARNNLKRDLSSGQVTDEDLIDDAVYGDQNVLSEDDEDIKFRCIGCREIFLDIDQFCQCNPVDFLYDAVEPVANDESNNSNEDRLYYAVEMDVPKLGGYSPSLKKCLKYLLRAVPKINIHLCHERVGITNYLRDPHLNINILLPELAEDNIIPLNRYKEPAELQHLSRCAIRKCLYDNWELPRGIDELPIPNKLKEFLDLQMD